MNINRGLFTKEELLINTILEKDFEIFTVSECEIKDFDENKPFSIAGYKIFFPLEKQGT